MSQPRRAQPGNLHKLARSCPNLRPFRSHTCVGTVPGTRTSQTQPMGGRQESWCHVWAQAQKTAEGRRYHLPGESPSLTCAVLGNGGLQPASATQRTPRWPSPAALLRSLPMQNLKMGWCRAAPSTPGLNTGRSWQCQETMRSPVSPPLTFLSPALQEQCPNPGTRVRQKNQRL